MSKYRKKYEYSEDENLIFWTNNMAAPRLPLKLEY